MRFLGSLNVQPVVAKFIGQSETAQHRVNLRRSCLSVVIGEATGKLCGFGSTIAKVLKPSR